MPQRQKIEFFCISRKQNLVSFEMDGQIGSLNPSDSLTFVRGKRNMEHWLKTVIFGLYEIGDVDDRGDYADNGALEGVWWYGYLMEVGFFFFSEFNLRIFHHIYVFTLDVVLLLNEYQNLNITFLFWKWNCSQSAAMKCFTFSYGEKKDEPKGFRSTSGPSENSTCADIRRSGSELNSLEASDSGSTESLRRNAIPSLSQRPSNLRVFTVSELKSATRNFSRSVKIGEGGFGCVYLGLIKSVEVPSGKIEVAIKQLSKRGMQVRVWLLFLSQVLSNVRAIYDVSFIFMWVPIIFKSSCNFASMQKTHDLFFQNLKPIFLFLWSIVLNFMSHQCTPLWCLIKLMS